MQQMTVKVTSSALQTILTVSRCNENETDNNKDCEVTATVQTVFTQITLYGGVCQNIVNMKLVYLPRKEYKLPGGEQLCLFQRVIIALLAWFQLRSGPLHCKLCQRELNTTMNCYTSRPQWQQVLIGINYFFLFLSVFSHERFPTT